ncbi:MAG: hypothetical protein WCF18_17435 [Chthoniobacteraceae bacterium]
MRIEPLEARIAPAVFFTVADVDGDLVTISISKGRPPSAVFQGDANLDFSPDGPFVLLGGGRSLRLELQGNPVFNGANIIITAKPQDIDGDGKLDGDGRVDVGQIEASGIDLGSVTVDGNLDQIFAGSGSADPKKGLASLKTQSLGRLGTSNGAAGLAVSVDGRLGALNVVNDVVGTLIFAKSIGTVSIGGSLIGNGDVDGGKILTSTAGGASGAIGSITIKGNPEGGGGPNSGSIQCGGPLGSVTIGGSVIGGVGGGSADIRGSKTIGPVKIGGNLEGGLGTFSAFINATGTIASITVGGSLLGLKQDSGAIEGGGAIGPIKIGGSVIGAQVEFSGASVVNSGSIQAGGDIASIRIGGSLVGGATFDTGVIVTKGTLGPVTILGDILGHDGEDTGNLFRTGMIDAKRIVSVTVGGSIIAGRDDGAGGLFLSGVIRAEDDMGAITVKGSLVGNETQSVLIIARGQATQGTTTDVAIKSITVGGRVEYAQILAGYTVGNISPPESVNGDAQIGTVKVGGAWIASRLAAGTNRGVDKIAGTDDDTFNGAGSASIFSKIASITIGGAVFGTHFDLSTTDSFRFMAQKIGSFKVGGVAFPLTIGADNLSIGSTADTHVFDAF